MTGIKELIEKAALDLVSSEYAIALTGAGISTESGIPDFRGPSGLWTKNPGAERRAYLGYQRFSEDPKGWWEERMRESGSVSRYTEASPNTGHSALADLESKEIIKCIITQNVDILHEKAGSVNLLKYHGTSMKLRCMTCGQRFDRDEFDLEGLAENDGLPPHCPQCEGIIKTDSVSFGEPIPSDVARQSLEQAWQCDLMLICGTSAVVYPFAQLPRIARQRKSESESTSQSGLFTAQNTNAVTIIEINAEPTPLTEDGISDYLIQGQIGDILPALVKEVERISR